MINTKDIFKKIEQDLELSDFPEETRAQIITKLGENILKRVTIAVLDNLPDGARAEFDSLSADGDTQKMQEFLSSNIPNINELIEDEIRKNIEEFKNMKNQLLADE